MLQTDILDYIENFVQHSQKLEVEQEPTKQVDEKKESTENKKIQIKTKKPRNIEDHIRISNPFPDYRPPEWQRILEDEKELSYTEISNFYDKKLRYKKVETLTETELNILKNVRILKDCYCTSEPELILANFFIGKFDLDPFSNPYAKTANPQYATENIICLDGHSPEKDGFNIENWPLDRKSIFTNPPFSKLPKASNICNIVCKRDAKPGIALIGNLDYNNYVKESFLHADYCILLGRVQYKPMVGLTVSSPRWNSIMTIYNSKVNLTGSTKILLGDKEYYAIDLRNKKIINLNQIEQTELSF